MLDIFQLEFMQRAFIAGLALAPLLSVLGAFATLRRMSFFAEGVAHASLLGVALAIIAGVVPFYGALVIGIIFGILIFLLERYSKIASDATIGIIFTTGMALGIILISLQPGYQPDLISFLFGNILAVSWGDVWTILVLSVVILLSMYVLFKQFALLAFSEELAWTSGSNTAFLNLLFYVLLSLATVLGVKLLGIILVSALLITPAVTAKMVTTSFNSYLFSAVLFSIIAFVVGLFSSYYLDFPSGASIVIVATGLFVLVFIFKSLWKKSL